MNNRLLEGLPERIVAIIAPTVFIWGSFIARLEATGQPTGVMDLLIIASALQNNLIIVTRKIADFLPSGVQVLILGSR
jgi:predicted nucleic acid-binding protein